MSQWIQEWEQDFSMSNFNVFLYCELQVISTQENKITN